MQFRTVQRTDPDFPLMQDFVKTKIRSLCKGGVDRSYILLDALPKAHALVMAYEVSKTRNSQRTNVLGFAIVRRKSYYVYLDVICAQRVGSKLLEQIISLAREWKVGTIQIASVPAAMPYWLKMGFVNSRTSCKWDSDLEAAALKVAKTQVKPGKTNGIIQTYLKKLVAKKLGIHSSCKTVQDCSVDGYVMSLCLDQVGKNVDISKSSRHRASQSPRPLRRSSRLSS